MLSRGITSGLVILALVVLPAAGGEPAFPEFLDKAAAAIGPDAVPCPAAGAPPWVETSQFSTCAETGLDFKTFRKRWRRLLQAGGAFREDRNGGWDRMTTGIRSGSFWYQGFPGNVYFDEEQGRVFFTVRATLAPCPGPDPMLPRAGETVYRVGSPGVIKPEQSVSVRPDFPASLRQVRQSGWVVLRTIIDPQGVPTRVCVLDSSPVDTEMQEAAREAVERWRYDPALKDDRPVPFYLSIQINFTIQ